MNYIICLAIGFFMGMVLASGFSVSSKMESYSMLEDYCKSLEDRVEALETLNKSMQELIDTLKKQVNKANTNG